ncbi:MAG TPA: hypothetical protein DD490_32440, partial [Acidobacteria bacterium]|nr:hypothetical protein [Acidobacteriota bacterium]
MAYDPTTDQFEPGCPGDVLSSERLDALRERLDRLPDDLRRCFLLRHARGFSEDQVSVLLKLPLERVRTCLWQARARLGV